MAIVLRKRAPDGSKDENVFDIKPGVAIAIFIKNRNIKEKEVFYADLFGKREIKYHWLDRHNILNVEWKRLKPESPDYLFIPEDSSLKSEYDKYWKITEIFPLNNIGIVTARDELTIKWSHDELWQAVLRFVKLSPESARHTFNLGKDSIDWKVEWAQQDLKESGPSKDRITSILYRPFDIRYTYYTGNSSGFHCRPRPEIMNNMLKENLGFVFHRREELAVPYSHFLVTDKIVEHGALSSKTTCYLAPLYIYKGDAKSPNINPKLVSELNLKYGKTPSELEIFNYIYAVVHSNKYRTKYANFLKKDFPRIPFTTHYETFKQLAEIGKELINLHLMKTRLKSSIKFDVQGSNVVDFVEYKNRRVYINKEQFFDGIPENAWNFYIGGYQVLAKWLKSRKNRQLNSNEIEQFIQITEIINQTLDLMKKIDEIGFCNG